MTYPEQKALIHTICEEIYQTRRLTGIECLSSRLLDALRRVDRRLFIPDEMVRHAYENRPLGIGYGQTISQPYIVALMTALLDLNPGDKVLEIGTGCGYQSAILAELCKHLHSIEVVQPLLAQAQHRLQQMGYKNIDFHHGDGYHGWPSSAPFDAILVAAAADTLPPPLLEQLNCGGKLVAPLGRYPQSLTLISKDNDGVVEERKVLDVVFVPFVRT